MSPPGLVEHFFRHEYGRLVATFSRRVGVQHLEAIEDAVQVALMKALDSWTAGALPDNPSGWLFRVAHNELLGELRQAGNRRRLLERHGDIDKASQPEEAPYFESEIQDDLLRMLFVCCDPVLPVDSQLTLALKTLCGFSVREIALRLFTAEAAVYKRLSRARSRLSDLGRAALGPSESEYSSRVDAVHRVLYLLFTEGHLSHHGELAIRHELCGEALRLTQVLARHPSGQGPETCALLALMHLHAARLPAREGRDGGLLLLNEQDRSAWDQKRIEEGLLWLARSAEGDSFSRYHAEAGIAAEHCLAPSLAETRWERVVSCYALLEQVEPSALHRLGHALALAEWKGAEAGLELLRAEAPPEWLSDSYQWAAAMSDLSRRCGDSEAAAKYLRQALELAPTTAIQELLERRLHEQN